MFLTLKYAVIIGSCLTTVGFIFGMFFPSVITAMFTTDIELRTIATRALRISVIMFPIIGSQIVITNFFQSIGKAKVSIFLSLTRQFLFLVPSLFVFPHLLGLDGAWASIPISDGLSVIVTTITILYFIRKFKSGLINNATK